MTEDRLITIEELVLNFYTKSGVVKAVDNVNLDIKKKETFGLVGESGCGKTVTANTIMGLIAMPPGRIESGKVIYTVPKNFADQIVATYGKIKKGQEQPPIVGDGEERYIDLLKLNDKGLRKIRGKSISMIFQEPMTALNPTIRVGDQISEILLLHERSEMAEAVVRKLEKNLTDLKEYRRADLIVGEKGMMACSNCKAPVPEKTEKCPNCQSYFKRVSFRSLKILKVKRDMKLYKQMVKNPDNWKLRAYGRIPILRGYRKHIKKEAAERAVRLLRLVRIPDPETTIRNYPFELSGGMQQRVMISMALACRPQLLIADEPTTALDVTIQAQILKLMKELQEELGTSILLITHNLGVVAESCDRVGVMYAGAMAEVAANKEIFKEPLHPYTQGLINSIPKVNVEMPRLEIIEGNVPNLIKPPEGCRFHTRCPFAMDICTKDKPLMMEVRPLHFVACHLYGRAMP